MLTKLLNLIFPPKCVFCGQITKCDDGVCLGCRQNLPYCMARNVAAVEGENFAQAVSAFVYEGFVADSIYRFKERGCRWYAKSYAKYVKLAVEHYFGGIEFDYIVSAPISKGKLASRGYDQTKLIAKHLEREIGVTYLANAIAKVRETQKQQGLSQLERKSNLTDAFEVSRRAEIEARRILFVDDVFTTGSTAEECSYALIANGAAEVYVAAVAATQLSM